MSANDIHAVATGGLGFINSGDERLFWSPDFERDNVGSIDLPGPVLHLASVAETGELWALVLMGRKPWQFWLPDIRQRWIKVALP
jgi:hypothetical protein